MSFVRGGAQKSRVDKTIKPENIRRKMKIKVEYILEQTKQKITRLLDIGLNDELKQFIKNQLTGLKEKLLKQDSKNISRWTEVLESELTDLNRLLDKSLDVSGWISQGKKANTLL